MKSRNLAEAARLFLYRLSGGTEEDQMRLSEIARGLTNAKRVGASLTKRSDTANSLKISPEEVLAVLWITAAFRRQMTRIAELGSYLGHTANLLADATRPDCVIEVYDLFEHNERSRNRLRQFDGYAEDSFYGIWERNTARNRAKIELHRGDILHVAGEATAPLDMVFVDIVKHPSVMPVLSGSFYDRLRVGGFLMHQDYFHFQSPWIVYQMEMLTHCFKMVGNFGNNMAVFVKTKDLTDDERRRDFVDGVSLEVKYRLFDMAIAKFPGNRALLLSVSKLRLAIDDPTFDLDELYATIVREAASGRVRSHADFVMRSKEHLRTSRW